MLRGKSVNWVSCWLCHSDWSSLCGTWVCRSPLCRMVAWEMLMEPDNELERESEQSLLQFGLSSVLSLLMMQSWLHIYMAPSCPCHLMSSLEMEKSKRKWCCERFSLKVMNIFIISIAYITLYVWLIVPNHHQILQFLSTLSVHCSGFTASNFTDLVQRHRSQHHFCTKRSACLNVTLPM